jgi:hypothetical protein
MSAMEAIMSEIKNLTMDDANLGIMQYYSCDKCGTVTGGNKPPSKCIPCGAEDPFWFIGGSRDEAMNRRKTAQQQSPAATPAPAEAPKKRTVTKKAEPAKQAPVAPVPTVEATPDLRAERDAKVQAFIAANNLNEIEPVFVGHATVQTVGFTLWMNKRPVYRLHESFESAQDFAQAYNEARAEQPATRIDVAACCGVDNIELEACLFRGDLMASLNSGHGTIQVRRGDRVKIGALKTTTGKLRFVVI